MDYRAICAKASADYIQQMTGILNDALTKAAVTSGEERKAHLQDADDAYCLLKHFLKIKQPHFMEEHLHPMAPDDGHPDKEDMSCTTDQDTEPDSDPAEDGSADGESSKRTEDPVVVSCVPDDIDDRDLPFGPDQDDNGPSDAESGGQNAPHEPLFYGGPNAILEEDDDGSEDCPYEYREGDEDEDVGFRDTMPPDDEIEWDDPDEEWDDPDEADNDPFQPAGADSARQTEEDVEEERNRYLEASTYAATHGADGTYDPGEEDLPF